MENCSHMWTEPWSSGYGRRLMFQKSWFRIQAPYTEWTFSHLFVPKIVMFVWKDENKRKKMPGFAQIKKRNLPLSLHLIITMDNYFDRLSDSGKVQGLWGLAANGASTPKKSSSAFSIPLRQILRWLYFQCDQMLE